VDVEPGVEAKVVDEEAGVSQRQKRVNLIHVPQPSPTRRSVHHAPPTTRLHLGYLPDKQQQDTTMSSWQFV
jgi:hypothetical protein